MEKIKKQVVVITALIFIAHGFSFGQGSSYAGPYTSSSPIVWDGMNNKTISNMEINNVNGNCISLSNCSNITIKNCKLGPSKNEGVNLYNCTNITITNCSMNAIETGVYANQCSGIKVIYNDVKNVQGPMPRGQMVQFNNVTGGGNSISYNVVENILGQSNPEDEISVYMSSGIVGDPIQVIGNWIRGGGPSGSGGGIMVGDYGGSHIVVKDNILVDPGQYGISISSGTDISIKNNKIYAKQQSFTNVGLYVWNQSSTDCFSDSIMKNQVYFINSKGEENDFWNAGNCGTVAGWGTNTASKSLNSSILPATIIGRAKAVTTGTNPAPTSVNYKIFPNPVFGQSIIITSESPNNEKVSIYNLNGQTVIDQSINTARTEIDTSRLATGVYFVRISDAGGKIIEIRKIIATKI